ncbi:Hypothetical predicted protein, partial [Paramuricea clavata]
AEIPSHRNEVKDKNKIPLQKKQQTTSSSAKLITEDQLLTFAESDHNDLLRISEEIDTSRIPEDMQLLWDMQMKHLAAKSPNGHRWHPRIVRLALDMYVKNPHVLDTLRQFVTVLPSNRLIRYYKNAVTQEPGWNKEVIKWCRREAERWQFKSADYWGGFILDEMKIQEDLQMAVRNGQHTLVGLISLGGLYEDMKLIETGKMETKSQIATHLLQYVFLSDCGFRFPLAHFPTTTCPPLYLQFWEGVLQMKKAGFR